MNKPYTSPCARTNLRRAAGVLTEFYDTALSILGITSAQYFLLINISRFEPVDTTSLAKYVGLDRSTLVRNIRILENSGWVEDIASGIKHQFRLTEAGKKIIESAAPVWETAQKKFMKHMGKNDADKLIQLLLKVQELKWPAANKKSDKNRN